MSEQATQGDKPVITYCLEYAKSQSSKCNDCGKTIPHKSLRAAEIYRKNKKAKKYMAKHTWYHFKCFEVPEMLTHMPAENVRGFPALTEKDKARVEKLFKSGVGSSWKKLIEQGKASKTEEELEAEKEEQDKKDKKKKEDEESSNMDMTAILTGTQESDKKEKATQPKATQPKAANKKQPKKAAAAAAAKKEQPKTAAEKDVLKPKTKKKNRVTKKAPEAKPKEIVLPKEDMKELQSIAQEIKNLK